MAYRFELRASALDPNAADAVELSEDEYARIVDLVNRGSGVIRCLRCILGHADARFGPTDAERVIEEINELREVLNVDATLLAEQESAVRLPDIEEQAEAPFLDEIEELFAEASSSGGWVFGFNPTVA